MIRPDNAFPVRVVNKFMEAPYGGCLGRAIHIGKYVESVPRKGILNGDHEHTNIEALSYSNWAGSPNSPLNNRVSITRYCDFVGRNFLSGKKQEGK